MRGIQRVITGILLAAAICGSAAFARSVGRDAAVGAGDVQLAAAPPQHAQSPHDVRVRLYPLLAHGPTVAAPVAKETSRPSLADAPVLTGPSAAPVEQMVLARPAVRGHSPPVPVHAPSADAPSADAPSADSPSADAPSADGPTVQLPKPSAPGSVPAPAAPSAPSAPATPAPAPPEPSEPRILAKVPLTQTLTWKHAKGIGHGQPKSDPDGDTPNPTPLNPVPPNPAPPNPAPPHPAPPHPAPPHPAPPHPAPPHPAPPSPAPPSPAPPNPAPPNPALPAQQPLQQPAAPTAPSAAPTIPVVVLSPSPPGGDVGNGHGHGHAYGRLKQGFDDHD